MNKENYEGKWLEQRPPKSGQEHRRPFIQRSNREVYETFTPLNQDISVVLTEMERKDLTTLSTPRKNDVPMGNDLNQYCR